MITLEQFRDYLGRREHEARRAIATHREDVIRKRDAGENYSLEFERENIGATRANLYRELIEIIDGGEFPE